MIGTAENVDERIKHIEFQMKEIDLELKKKELIAQGIG